MAKNAVDQGVDPLGDRSHFRVAAQLPLIYELVEPNAREALTEQILSTLDPPKLEVDPGLVAWLDRIERKLDLMLDSMQLGEGPLLRTEDTKSVLISGSGLSFDVGQEIPAGSHLLLCFELPGARKRLVRCIGKVAHASPSEESSGSTVGVAFETIRPGDVDAVVEYSVSVQRHQIRAAHAQGDGQR